MDKIRPARYTGCINVATLNSTKIGGSGPKAQKLHCDDRNDEYLWLKHITGGMTN